MPFPTPRLASIAFRSLGVDHELSPLVQREFFVEAQLKATVINEDRSLTCNGSQRHQPSEQGFSDLRIEYRATTNRMLRVAVNGFMESLALVLNVMEDLDVDTLQKDR